MRKALSMSPVFYGQPYQARVFLKPKQMMWSLNAGTARTSEVFHQVLAVNDSLGAEAEAQKGQGHTKVLVAKPDRGFRASDLLPLLSVSCTNSFYGLVWRVSSQNQLQASPHLKGTTTPLKVTPVAPHHMSLPDSPCSITPHFTHLLYCLCPSEVKLRQGTDLYWLYCLECKRPSVEVCRMMIEKMDFNNYSCSQQAWLKDRYLLAQIF